MRRVIYIPVVASSNIPTANLIGNWDAQLGITIVTGVSQWDDQSGNSNHLVQANTSKQPTFSGTGSSSIVTFNGSSHFLTKSFTLAQPSTVYVVCKQITFSAFGCITDGFGFASMAILDDASTPNISMYAGGALGTTNAGLTMNTIKVVTCVFNGASSSESVNDNTKNTGSTSGSGSGFSMGAAGGGTSNFLNCAIQEAAVYNVAHSAATQTSVIGILRTKWGI